MRWLLLFLVGTVVSLKSNSSAEVHLSEAAGDLYERHVAGDKHVSRQAELLQYRTLSSADKAALKSLDGAVSGKRRCSRRGNMVKWGGGRKRVGRHLYGQRMLYTWRCNRYHYVRWWWALLRRNAYNHRLHGRLQWRWTNSYKRIGVHRYRYQTLYKNYQGRWRRIGGKWRLNRRNAYYRKPRYFWGKLRRQGRHQYRHRCLKRWTGSHWVTVRCKWHLHKRNAYAHRLAGQTQWRWGRYKRVGRHRFRHRSLYKRDFNGKWKFVRAYWKKTDHNKYAHRLAGRTKWMGGRRYKRIGRHLYREWRLYKRDFNGNFKFTGRKNWRLHRRNAYAHRLAGRTQWRWGGYKRIGDHRYRLRRLYKRDFNGNWRFVRSYWHKVNHNYYGLCARLYQHSNFRGRVYNVYNNVRFLRGFNDEVSSVRVYRGCHIRLYQHWHYRGRSYGYGAGSFNYHTIRRTIGNDVVSSVRVWRR